MTGGTRVRFLWLYIKNNMRRRMAGVLIPLFSFFLSALLVSITVFYLSLEKNIQEDGISYPGLDVRVTLDAAYVPDMEAAFADADWITLRTKLEFTDLMPLYQEEIAAFDENPVHKTLPLVYVRPGSVISDLLAEYGYDIASLPSDAVYVSQYAAYYFRHSVTNDHLTLDAVVGDGGQALCLNIAGVMDADVCDFLGAMIVTADRDVFAAVKAETQNASARLYYAVSDKSQPAVTSRRIAEEAPPEPHLTIRILSGWENIESTAIYSGDAAIAVFNFFFAALCLFCTLKLKFDGEAADYRRMQQMGLSPLYRALLPFCELTWLALLADIGALTAAVVLFRIIAPYEDRAGVQSSIYSYYFKPDWTWIGLTAVLFFLLYLVMLCVTVYRYILRSPRERCSYVKQSAGFYYRARRFSPPYILVRLARNRLSNLFFVFMLCFPLFVSAMYGTGAVNLVSNDKDLFDGAAFTVARQDVDYGSTVTQEMAEQLRQLPGVAAVHTFHKTNRQYVLSSSTSTLGVQLWEHNDYLTETLTPYLAEGSFADVVGHTDSIVLTDNAGQFSIGDTVTLQESGRRFTVGAILRNVPLEFRRPFALVDPDTLRSLAGETILPQDLHIYPDGDLSEADYRLLCSTLPTLISDPHASYENRRDEIAVLDKNGQVTHDAASTMNVLIAVISVSSVFLYHLQQNVNRRQELSILYRLGLGRNRIRLLLHAESLLLLAVGIGIFALLYGLYVGSILHTIASSGAYQYAGFSFAWREIFLISLGMIGAVMLADGMIMREERTV